MKRIISVIILCVLCFSLAGCSKTYHGTDELMKKARKEIPIADAETIDMEYAGMCVKGDKAIAWFISGNEYQAHYYLPIEIEIKDNGEDYKFVHTYKPMDRAEDIAVLLWRDSYVFLVNNPSCVEIRITDDKNVHEFKIAKDEYPYSCSIDLSELAPSFEYVFLDKDRNELMQRKIPVCRENTQHLTDL